MSIYYPSSTGGQQTITVSGSRSQYAIPSALESFPIVISGSTSPTQICTLFVPPTYLYQMSGAYGISVVCYYTSSNSSTFKIEFQGGPSVFTGSLSNYAPFGQASTRAIRLSDEIGSYTIIQDISQLPVTDGVSIPIMGSGSTTDYTASFYGVYLSPIS